MSYGGDDDDQFLLLQRFGEWLRDARAEPERPDRNGTPMASEAPQAEADVGLYRLAEEFTALRHEVKLQTRSSRGLEEEAKTLAAALRQAIEALRSIEPREAQAAWSAGKALATALAELDDALERGRQQTEKAVALLAQVKVAALVSDFYERQSWFIRRLHAGFYRRLLDGMNEAEPSLQRRAVLDALVDGYRLIQKRLSQSMAAEGIARIDAVGKPVDPEQMVVVEVVDADDRPSGVVFDELRRGYTWNGRVLRYAEVRATKAAHP